jgi:hypothetical protein
MSARRALSLLVLSPFLGGCAGERGPSDWAESGAVTAQGDTTGGPEGEDEGAIRFDTPTEEGDEGAEDGAGEEGCEKVDFLFVVDNSGSMDDDQANLIANFPGFMHAIETALEVEDFHVMVVDTDAGGNTHPGCVEWWDEQGDPYHLLPCPLPNVPAGADPQMLELLEECDLAIGAGVDTPMGFSASNAECDFASGRRFVDGAEPDLAAAFSCAARVGIGGDNSERPAQALIAALGPEISGPGGCNEGFLRPDALLVVTILTDEQDTTSEPREDPGAWAEAVMAAKGGKETSVVMLGLLGGIDYPGPWLETMVASFTHSRIESVTAADYRPFFEEVVGDIDVACDGFVPEG